MIILKAVAVASSVSWTVADIFSSTKTIKWVKTNSENIADSRSKQTDYVQLQQEISMQHKRYDIRPAQFHEPVC